MWLVLKYTIRGVDAMLRQTSYAQKLSLLADGKRLPRNHCLSPDSGFGSIVLDFKLLDEVFADYLTEGVTPFKHCFVDVPLFRRKHSDEATSSCVFLPCFLDDGINQALDTNIVLIIVAFQQSTWTRGLPRIAISVVAVAAAATPRSFTQAACRTIIIINSGHTYTCY